MDVSGEAVRFSETSVNYLRVDVTQHPRIFESSSTQLFKYRMVINFRHPKMLRISQLSETLSASPDALSSL